ILRGMKPGYPAMEYKSTVRKLRAIRPGLALSSDFIVGFPGETDEDFGKMMKPIDDLEFTTSFSTIALHLHLQPAPRPARRGAARRHAACRQAGAPAATAGHDRRQRQALRREPR